MAEINVGKFKGYDITIESQDRIIYLGGKEINSTVFKEKVEPNVEWLTPQHKVAFDKLFENEFIDAPPAVSIPIPVSMPAAVPSFPTHPTTPAEQEHSPQTSQNIEYPEPSEDKITFTSVSIGKVGILTGILNTIVVLILTVIYIVLAIVTKSKNLFTPELITLLLSIPIVPMVSILVAFLYNKLEFLQIQITTD